MARNANLPHYELADALVPGNSIVEDIREMKDLTQAATNLDGIHTPRGVHEFSSGYTRLAVLIPDRSRTFVIDTSRRSAATEQALDSLEGVPKSLI